MNENDLDKFFAEYMGRVRTDYRMCFSLPTKELPEIKKVIYNPPATIVMWADNTKTVVKAEHEKYDPEKGLAMAIAKKALGNKGNYFNEFKKWRYAPNQYDDPSICVTPMAAAMIKRINRKRDPKWLAYQRLQNALHDKKATKADLLIAMEEASGYLGEVLDD